MNTIQKRIILHLSFLFSACITLAFMMAITNEASFTFQLFGLMLLQTMSGVFFLIAPPVYLNIYWLIPKFLVLKKYLLFALFSAILILIWGWIMGYGEPWMDEHLFQMKNQNPSLETGISGMIFILLISTLLHLSYRWYTQSSKIKQIENDRLQLELSVLKNQINPHFFFNTLNNLYALSLEQSEQTPSVILKLSEMMRYTIYECKAPKVSITSEVSYLDNFIALQKMRQHKRGVVTFQKSIEDFDLQIAPMILIVFLENAYKHGFDLMEKDAFINLQLEVTKTTLFFTIENNFIETTENIPIGIGLENVKRRLALTYPSNHNLHITNSNGMFKVQLKLNLA
ncbi:sensor histidine kinase [Tenacibaculum sp.]|uniref:sensor histidine kinase n=1 Tax=Tenacibaculum sp. TaxID=1906242 RepID=UPI003D10ECCD